MRYERLVQHVVFQRLLAVVLLLSLQLELPVAAAIGLVACSSPAFEATIAADERMQLAAS